MLQGRPDWGDFLTEGWGGGVLFDLGAHPLALVLLLADAGAGRPRPGGRGPGPAWRAPTTWRSTSTPMSTLTFASGLHARVETSWRDADAGARLPGRQRRRRGAGRADPPRGARAQRRGAGPARAAGRASAIPARPVRLRDPARGLPGRLRRRRGRPTSAPSSAAWCSRSSAPATPRPGRASDRWRCPSPVPGTAPRSQLWRPALTIQRRHAGGRRPYPRAPAGRPRGSARGRRARRSP